MKQLIEETYAKIGAHLIRTPLFMNDSMEKDLGCSVHFKMEHLQLTGSFKLRGVLSKFSELTTQGKNLRQVVAASTGNHALAVCHAANSYKSQPIIFVPENVSESKYEMIENLGVDVYRRGKQSGDTEIIAQNWAHERSIPFIHPYNDIAVVAGQGTIGLELAQQLDQIDSVFVPVGGGGLISGIAAYLKEVKPDITMVGVQPANASEMADSMVQGKIVEASDKSTVSDGTAGGIDPESITFQFCKDLVDEFVLVSELEIVAALQLLEQHLDIRVEPAAGLALAGIQKSRNSLRGKNCVAIICGGNIDPERYKLLLQEFGFTPAK